MSKVNNDYGLSPDKSSRQMNEPKINYLPQMPRLYNPKIGLIGAGGISEYHLKNYAALGLDVVAIADLTLSKAAQRRDQFYPKAQIYDDYKQILEREDIEVVDITLHPKERFEVIKEALRSKKHVLSQKPFVLNLNDGKELVKIAKENDVKLAVNQNGRWAPHFSYMLAAISSGLIGRPLSVDFSLQWDQTWVAGNPGFENIKHLILFDFAIHWFDIAACFMGTQEATQVFASAVRYDEQKFIPPALASCIIDYEQAQVRMAFNAHTVFGTEDVTTIVGTKGTLRSRGSGLNSQPVMEIFTEDGEVKVPLEGNWFENGFKGTMTELLCAIEENREPVHSAGNNLKSLALCFAALESANQKKIMVPGEVDRVM